MAFRTAVLWSAVLSAACRPTAPARSEAGLPETRSTVQDHRQGPGVWLSTPVALTPAQAQAGCVDLPWDQDLPGSTDTLLSHTCRISDAGPLGGADGRWRFALYHHVSIIGATAATPQADRPFLPDTVREAELVVLRTGDEWQAVWHDRLDLQIVIPFPPRLHRLAGSELLELVTCLNGTGGCSSAFYRLTPGTPWPPIRQAYAESLRAELPEGWGLGKGIQARLDSMQLIAGVYVTGDGNCCPLFVARARLSLEGDTLRLHDLVLSQDTTDIDGHTTIVPGIAFGAIGPHTSAGSLVARLDAGQRVERPVHLGEGICTPGTVLYPGTPREAEIAWADSTRRAPAFVRVSRRPSDWRTTLGVTTGTVLTELERLRRGPLRFQGFGWDYGGRTSWSEPVPRALSQDGHGALTLGLSPDSASGARMHQTPEATLREVLGDRVVWSDHPLIRRLTIEVELLELRWGEPAVQHSCQR